MANRFLAFGSIMGKSSAIDGLQGEGRKVRFLAILATLALPSATDAQASLTGNDLLEVCAPIDGSPPQPICVAFIGGFMDGISLGSSAVFLQAGRSIDESFEQGRQTIGICPPEGVLGSQFIDIVIAALKSEPEIRHYDAGVLIHRSISKAFPCQPAQY